MDERCDYLVIGGGFYGCCLALFLRSLSPRVMLVEARGQLMDRASRVNQARVHTGFHYPRSSLTAVKSLILRQRFVSHFGDAIVDNFQMLYAISRQRSKVSAKRFHRMFRDIGAPIEPATPRQCSLFDFTRIEAVFACSETAFDHRILRSLMLNRLDAADISVVLNTEAHAGANAHDGMAATLSDGRTVRARYVFNVTYAGINELLTRAGQPSAGLKHEMTEIALVTPPEELLGYGITIMDGPFFSLMPFPAESLHSLTHVRYTPHWAWSDTKGPPPPDYLVCPSSSQARQMILDGQRYVPSLARVIPRKSVYDIKTVLLRNESDDGRPILYHRRPQDSRLISVLGGKIDNVFDLFDLLRSAEPEFSAAHTDFVFGIAR